MGEHADDEIDRIIDWHTFRGRRSRPSGAVIHSDELQAMGARHLKNLLDKDVTSGTVRRITEELERRDTARAAGLKRLAMLKGQNDD